MSTRILINATILNNPRQTGLGVYAAAVLPRIVAALGNESGIAEIVVIGDSERITTACGTVTTQPKVHLRAVATNHPVRRLIALNRIALAESRGKVPALFYSPTHHGLIAGSIRQVITVHDLFARLFPRNYRFQSWYFRWYLPGVLCRASRVIVDSTATANDLCRFYPKAPPTEVIHLAARSDLTESSASEITGLVDRPFFLFIGPSYPYKNCERLIEAFAALGRSAPAARLVFAGGRKVYVDQLKRKVSSQGLSADDVIFLEYVTPSQLSWLYRRAVALMITTLYEGFGLPALEAMRCDCPVIASRRGSLPEICGDAALYVDPENIPQITEAMSKLGSAGPDRKTLIAAGRHNVERFGWEQAASNIHNVIMNCIP